MIKKEQSVEKIRKLILTPEYWSSMKIECGAKHMDLIELIWMVKENRKVIYFSRQFIVEREKREANRKSRYA